MKVDNHHPSLAQAGQVEQRDAARKTQGAGGHGHQDAGPATMNHLSQAASDTRQDIDTVRVEALRDAIREGRLDIRAERIADSLIASVQDLLGGEDRQA